jgi:ubiquinol-cytochrome c reductase iron-sulfur subunit
MSGFGCNSDLSNIEMGRTITVKWRGKPVFIRHITPAEINSKTFPMEHLRDQETDVDHRTLMGIRSVLVCPHLGCVPIETLETLVE